MKVQSRKGEYNSKAVEELGSKYGNVIDIQPAIEGQSLEGKGSIVLDDKNRKVYCVISERACLETIQNWVDILNTHCQEPYKLVTINSKDPVS